MFKKNQYIYFFTRLLNNCRNLKQIRFKVLDNFHTLVIQLLLFASNLGLIYDQNKKKEYFAINYNE